jgi:hypothetical protein
MTSYGPVSLPVGLTLLALLAAAVASMTIG